MNKPKTAAGLVEYAKKAKSEGWGYIWGSFGQECTDSFLNQKLKQYPKEVGAFKRFIETHWMRRRVTDCVGLIKSYLWADGDKCRYEGKFDLNANQMIERATVKGTIDTIPERPGILVWRKGHIAVYIGGGKVIESRGTRVGVIESPLNGSLKTNNAYPWTHWCECPFLTYTVEAVQKPVQKVQRPIVKFGETSNLVSEIQAKLIAKGYKLTKDGLFGAKTLDAVKAFQMENGLSSDGIVGSKTWDILLK